MTNFNEYAEYYDILYGEKDYDLEARYVEKLIKRFVPGAETILDLGCGTGRHDITLCQNGYLVHGVDRSDEMIRKARHNADSESLERVSFQTADIRLLDLGRSFDVVVSLFHVLSYQNTNDDLSATLNTVRRHLEPGGLFVFDCWYGPAVLTQRPTVRTKRINAEGIRAIRIAEPELLLTDNCVDINYTLLILNEMGTTGNEINECHRMRYFFYPEVSYMLERAGFSLLLSEEFLTGRPPGEDTWSVGFVARAVAD